MQNKKPNTNQRPSISKVALALEIENVTTHFETSCTWLASLADNIAAFPDMSTEATDLLSKLRRRALKGEIKKAERKDVYKIIETFRLYSRMVASEDGPLSCLETVGSVEVFKDHLDQLRRVVGVSPKGQFT
jgi:hypothetical protein